MIERWCHSRSQSLDSLNTPPVHVISEMLSLSSQSARNVSQVSSGRLQLLSATPMIKSWTQTRTFPKAVFGSADGECQTH